MIPAAPPAPASSRIPVRSARRCAIPLAALFLAFQCAGTLPAQSPSAEHVESGDVRSPSGDLLQYRIRLLPVASFPSLPLPVAAELSRRRCMIPQSFEARQPENVIHGAFRNPASSDWAALCSSNGSTTLYVFFAGQWDSPSPLRTQPDTAWLGAEPGSSVYGSAWGISTLSLAALLSSPQLRSALPLDHDAIDDAHLEHADTIRYFHSGEWLTLHPAPGR